MAGLALSATVGCGFTAQIGAMRINEEIDALEVMARAVAAVPGDHPDHRRLRRRHPAVRARPAHQLLRHPDYRHRLYGQSTGTYDHYFNLFLPPQDVLWSFLKVLVFAVVIILTHCYYGYRASGGPAGVGSAVGRAVRFSIVAINIIDLFLSLAIWGSTTTVRIAG